jgi:hypothetical protein
MATFPTDDEIKALEATHKTIGVVTAADGKSWRVILRKPNRGEYKRFRAFSNNPQRVDVAQETLFNDICVWPAGSTEREALLNEWPGIPEACGKMLMELAGMAGTEQGKG